MPTKQLTARTLIILAIAGIAAWQGTMAIAALEDGGSALAAPTCTTPTVLAREGGGPVWPTPGLPTGASGSSPSSPGGNQRPPPPAQAKLPRFLLALRSARPLVVDVVMRARRTYAGRLVHLEAKTPHGPWVVVSHARLNRASVGRFRVGTIAATSRLRAFLPRTRTNPGRLSNEIVAYPPRCLREVFVESLRRYGLPSQPATGAGPERWGILGDVYRNASGELRVYEFATDSEAARAALSIQEPSAWLLSGPLIVFSVGSSVGLATIQGWTSPAIAFIYRDSFACNASEQAQGTAAVCIVHTVQVDERPASGVTVCFVADFNAMDVQFFNGTINGINLSGTSQVTDPRNQRRICVVTDANGNAAVEIFNSNPTVVDVTASLVNEGLLSSLKLPFPVRSNLGPAPPWSVGR